MADMLWKNSAFPSQWSAPPRFSIGYPTAGDLTTLHPPTVPGAQWYQAAYLELRTVIATAGLVFDPTDTGQLLQAIRLILRPTFELREDGSFELREDGSIELRN